MTEPLSNSGTLTNLFANKWDVITLSWFADDLTPTPEWAVPVVDASGWCVLDGLSTRKHVLTLAAGLIDAGVAHGDRVALMLSNRPEHWLADQAVLHAGGVSLRGSCTRVRLGLGDNPRVKYESCYASDAIYWLGVHIGDTRTN